MNHLQTLLSGALALMLSAPVLAQTAETPYRTEIFTGTFANVRAESEGGGLTVDGDSPDQSVRVEMFVRGNNNNDKLSQQELEERLARYDITIRAEGNTVVAMAKRKDRNNMDWKRGLSVQFVLHTPRAMSSDLNTSGGGIRLAHLTGQQRFRTSGGGITLTDLGGNVQGSTSGGGIKIDNCRDLVDVRTSGGGIDASDSKGSLKLTTSGGGLKLNNLSGTIDARTSGGGIRASQLDGTTDLETSGGSIQLDNIAGSLEATTSGGGIDATITRLGQYVRLSSSAGSVRVRMPLNQGMDLDLKGDRVTMPLTKFDGTAEKDRIRGRMNGGGVAVTLSSSSGNVSVSE